MTCTQNNIRNTSGISTSSQIFCSKKKVLSTKFAPKKLRLRSDRKLDRLLHWVQGGWIVSRVTRQQKLQLDLTFQQAAHSTKIATKNLSENGFILQKTAKHFRKMEMNFVVNLAQHFKSHQSSSSRPLLAPQNPAWCACSGDAGKLPCFLNFQIS